MENVIANGGIPQEWMTEKECPKCGAKTTGFDKDAIWEALSEQLREIGKNQAWLAKRLDISPAYLSLLRKGERAWGEELLTKAVNTIKT